MMKPEKQEQFIEAVADAVIEKVIELGGDPESIEITAIDFGDSSQMTQSFTFTGVKTEVEGFDQVNIDDLIKPNPPITGIPILVSHFMKDQTEEDLQINEFEWEWENRHIARKKFDDLVIPFLKDFDFQEIGNAISHIGNRLVLDVTIFIDSELQIQYLPAFGVWKLIPSFWEDQELFQRTFDFQTFAEVKEFMNKRYKLH